MNKRILLIGGAGFIGHSLALKLNSLMGDIQVSIVDSCQVNNLIQHQNNKMYRNFIHTRLDLLREQGIIPYFVDARDYHLLSKVVREVKPDVVIHLAAVAHANKSNKDPHSTFDHSLRTLENALDATCKKAPHFIYFSSSMIYGDFENSSVFEEDELKPKGIYGALKLSGELIVKAYNEVFEFPYTIIRPSALYGPRCVSRRVIQIFIENAFEGKDLVISGDGEEKLDFTYIDDLVEGVCKCIGNENAYDKTFNLTYGEGRSIKEVAELISCWANENLHNDYCFIKTKERDKLMPVRGTLNIDKAKYALGYKPKYPIEKGIKKYIGWYRENVYNKR